MSCLSIVYRRVKRYLKMIQTFQKLFLATLLFVSVQTVSQTFQPVDRAPHDITYYRETRLTKPLVKILYGRPSVKDGQEAFGEIVPFDELWRTGANEATELRLYQDIIFGNTPVKAGTYVVYTIPGEKEWEVILSSNTDVLGAFQYDPIFDVAKVRVPVSKAETLNTFSIAFKKTEDTQLQMVLGWGSTRIKVPMQIDQDEFIVERSKKKNFQKHKNKI